MTRRLLIIGAAKSGTSSLYRHLADHPDICGSIEKETYFFAPGFDPRRRHTIDEPVGAFDAYFDHATSADQLRVEATPFTMYDPHAATRIAALDGDTNVLAILRDPVERFYSDHRFLKQRGRLPEELHDVEAFVRRELDDPGNPSSTLAIGRYVEPLARFRTELGPDRTTALFFEDFRTDPATVLKALAVQHDVDPSFYDSYDFDVVNRTIAVARPRVNALRMRLERPARAVRRAASSRPALQASAERLLKAGRTRLDHWSGGEPDRTQRSDHATELLCDHYAPHDAALAELFGLSLPDEWCSSHGRERS